MTFCNFSKINIIYETCSKSNASYFIMLAHDVSSGWWWYGSRGWTFPPIFHSILLPCDRWQQRRRLTVWSLTWECRWSKDVSLNSSTWKKLHPLTFTDAYWTFMETKQWISTVRHDGVFQQWQQWQWVTSSGAYECGMQAFVHCWLKCIASGGDYVEK